AAFAADGRVIAEERWCSVGGGFVVPEAEVDAPTAAAPTVPHPYRTAAGLLALCRAHDLPIAEIVRRNELSLRTAGEVDGHI
ncbi:L-serine ammonia-lyase, partial [Acinetobacter baumannii]